LDDHDVSGQSAATAAAVAQGRERLRRHTREAATRPAAAEPSAVAADGPAQVGSGADAISLSGPNLAWNVDWGVLRSATEGARSVIEAMRLLGPVLPEQFQIVADASAKASEIIDALDSGQWNTEHDQALARLSSLGADAAAAGLPPEFVLPARLLSTTIRIRRFLSAETSAGAGDPAALAELDELIKDLESGVDPVRGMGARSTPSPACRGSTPAASSSSESGSTSAMASVAGTGPGATARSGCCAGPRIIWLRRRPRSLARSRSVSPRSPRSSRHWRPRRATRCPAAPSLPRPPSASSASHRRTTAPPQGLGPRQRPGQLPLLTGPIRHRCSTGPPADSPGTHWQACGSSCGRCRLQIHGQRRCGERSS
jgi:hypothetical protein